MIRRMATRAPYNVNLTLHLDDSPGSPLNRLEQKLDAVLAKFTTLIDMETQEMADLTALTEAVAAQTTVVDSAVALLGSLSQQIRDAGVDPAALQALADQIDAETSTLAAAVEANTPAAP